MSAEERKQPRTGQQVSPSMSELLASRAAADAVCTPPGRPRSSGPASGSGSGSGSVEHSQVESSGSDGSDAMAALPASERRTDRHAA